MESPSKLLGLFFLGSLVNIGLRFRIKKKEPGPKPWLGSQIS